MLISYTNKQLYFVLGCVPNDLIPTPNILPLQLNNSIKVEQHYILSVGSKGVKIYVKASCRSASFFSAGMNN